METLHTFEKGGPYIYLPNASSSRYGSALMAPPQSTYIFQRQGLVQAEYNFFIGSLASMALYLLVLWGTIIAAAVKAALQARFCGRSNWYEMRSLEL